MLIKRPKGWELPEASATSENVYHERRRILKAMAAAGLIGSTSLLGLPRRLSAEDAAPGAALYPAARNDRYQVTRPLTDERLVTTYNNFYEFGSHKEIHKAAQKLKTSPWRVTIDGMVEKPLEFDIEELLARVPLEERLYRLRCVEAWSMVIPWTGFPMKELVKLAAPLSSAQYVVMQTFEDKAVAPGQKQFWYPWPYTEGLTIAEATNDLAFLATGLYGRPMPKQNGAPLRLVTPWKYGFKSAKSLVRFTFTDKRPVTFWEALAASEYGFWANVNPEVPHPRWSQATERDVGSGERIPTQIYNGYGEFVADLYQDMPGEKLFM